MRPFPKARTVLALISSRCDYRFLTFGSRFSVVRSFGCYARSRRLEVDRHHFDRAQFDAAADLALRGSGPPDTRANIITSRCSANGSNSPRKPPSRSSIGSLQESWRERSQTPGHLTLRSAAGIHRRPSSVEIVPRTARKPSRDARRLRRRNVHTDRSAKSDPRRISRS